MRKNRKETHEQMKFFNWLFTKPEEEQKQEWTIQNDGWEHNAEKYDEFHKGENQRLNNDFNEELIIKDEFMRELH